MKKFSEFSFDEKRKKVCDAIGDLRKMASPGSMESYPWIREMFDNRCIVEDGSDLFEYPYTLGSDGAVTLGEPKAVKIAYEALAELKDIEIFEAGTYRGVTYVDADLDTMVKNFDEFKDQIKPVAVIGHDEDQDLLAKSGLPSAGWVTSLKKVGTKLVASFKDVPKVVADLIGKGAYKRISSEIYNDYLGKGNALRRVAILGGDVPEVKSLDDILALYSDEAAKGKTTWVTLSEAAPKSTGKEHEEMDIKKFEELQAQVTKLSETVAAQDATIKALTTEKETAVTKLSEIETAKKREDVKRFCDEAVKEGKLSPALRGLGLEKFMETLDDTKVVKFAEGDKAAEVSPLGFVKAFISAIPKNAIVKLGEIGGTGSEKKEEHDFMEKVAKYAEDHKVSRGKAISAVAKSDPELHAAYLESQKPAGK